MFWHMDRAHVWPIIIFIESHRTIYLYSPIAQVVSKHSKPIWKQFKNYILFLPYFCVYLNNVSLFFWSNTHHIEIAKSNKNIFLSRLNCSTHWFKLKIRGKINSVWAKNWLFIQMASIGITWFIVCLVCIVHFYRNILINCRYRSINNVNTH